MGGFSKHEDACILAYQSSLNNYFTSCTKHKNRQSLKLQSGNLFIQITHTNISRICRLASFCKEPYCWKWPTDGFGFCNFREVSAETILYQAELLNRTLIRECSCKIITLFMHYWHICHWNICNFCSSQARLWYSWHHPSSNDTTSVHSSDNIRTLNESFKI